MYFPILRWFLIFVNGKVGRRCRHGVFRLILTAPQDAYWVAAMRVYTGRCRISRRGGGVWGVLSDGMFVGMHAEVFRGSGGSRVESCGCIGLSILRPDALPTGAVGLAET